MPRKLIEIPVTAGVKIIMYLRPVLSAMAPINGFMSEGTLRITSSNPTSDREIPSLSISKGSIGARNDEYKSCKKCPVEMERTFDFL